MQELITWYGQQVGFFAVVGFAGGLTVVLTPAVLVAGYKSIMKIMGR